MHLKEVPAWMGHKHVDTMFLQLQRARLYLRASGYHHGYLVLLETLARLRVDSARQWYPDERDLHDCIKFARMLPFLSALLVCLRLQDGCLPGKTGNF